MYDIKKTSDFDEWYLEQDDKIRGLVTARFSRIEQAGHFGHVRSVGDGVYELKWKIGLRVYFSYTGKTEIIVLLGGTKHGQKKHIKKAKSLIGV